MDRSIEFLNRGGLPLWLIAVLFFVLWFAIFKQLYLIFVDLNQADGRALLFIKKQTLNGSNIKQIRAVVKIAPLLGLLGTVMGMIEVFETLSFYGTGDPKLISEGIAKATLPTMAGMVVAIVGLFFTSTLVALGKQALKGKG